MPALAYSIIPIIMIEAIYLQKTLKLSAKSAVKTVAISNIVSTAVGIPITWMILVVIQLITGGGSSYGIETVYEKVIAVTWQAPWLIPYESDLKWMVPIAGLVLLVPFYFVSWWSEFLVTKKLLNEINPSVLKKRIRDANLITYGLLTLWPVVFLIKPL